MVQKMDVPGAARAAYVVVVGMTPQVSGAGVGEGAGVSEGAGVWVTGATAWVDVADEDCVVDCDTVLEDDLEKVVVADEDCVVDRVLVTVPERVGDTEVELEREGETDVESVVDTEPERVGDTEADLERVGDTEEVTVTVHEPGVGGSPRMAMLALPVKGTLVHAPPAPFVLFQA